MKTNNEVRTIASLLWYATRYRLESSDWALLGRMINKFGGEEVRKCVLVLRGKKAPSRPIAYVNAMLESAKRSEDTGEKLKKSMKDVLDVTGGI